MRFLLLIFLCGCLEYTEPQKPIEQDSIWVLVENGDQWMGKWEGKLFILQFNNDTIYYKEIKNEMVE